MSSLRLDGIHHITAITGDAPRNVDFYTRVLGLRLVAKTVNQDDPTVYHLFYADEHGDAGSDITFFEYPGATPGRPGAGMVHRVVWQVGSPAAIDFWAGRLEELGVAFERADGALVLADYEGLAHELVVASVNEPLVAKHPDIPAEHALQGFLGVRAYSFDPAESARLLREVMGAEETSPGNFELTRGKRRGFIAFDPAPDAPGIQSGGSIHHVAWGTTAAEHPRWVEWLRESGVRSTPVIDRHYFHSIYYREPGGVLYEIADDAPGFAVDLPEAEFGTKIILPPWLEERRAEVEARLTPLPDPRADWAVR